MTRRIARKKSLLFRAVQLLLAICGRRQTPTAHQTNDPAADTSIETMAARVSRNGAPQNASINAAAIMIERGKVF
jgi:hypothetical protein